MISTTIIRHLIHNYEFGKKVLPYLKDEYFSHGHKTVFKIIQEYSRQYGEFPSLETISVDLSNLKVSDDEFETAKSVLIETAEGENTTSLEWLTTETEKFCQERAIEIALIKCIMINEGKDKKLNKGSIPQILTDALAVSFDAHLGHDYFDDAEKQFQFYHDKKKRIRWGIAKFDEATKGGLLPKTFNLFMAPTGVGKSLIMGSCAGHHLRCGYNVLYFTMEMSEEQIRQRIDANLLDIAMDQLEGVDRDQYFGALAKVRQKTQSRLVVKEYASGTPTIDHFEHFLNELRIKKSTMPDIIYVDYLNICASNRVRPDSGSYGYIKSISSEIRSMAQKYQIPIVSATQTNRAGYDNADIDMSVISESFGTGHEVDLLWGVMQTKDQIAEGHYKVNQLKSRYNDINQMPYFDVGVDKSHMRIYDVEESGQYKQPGKVPVPLLQKPVVLLDRFEGWS